MTTGALRVHYGFVARTRSGASPPLTCKETLQKGLQLRVLRVCCQDSRTRSLAHGHARAHGSFLCSEGVAPVVPGDGLALRRRSEGVRGNYGCVGRARSSPVVRPVVLLPPRPALLRPGAHNNDAQEAQMTKTDTRDPREA